MKKLIAIALLIVSPAIAQQQPIDPATLQRIIQTLQQQRNSALDAAAVADARSAQLADELRKLKAEIEAAKPKE